MYIPADFAERDAARARAFIEEHSFGMLVVPRADCAAPEIAHVPFLVDAAAAASSPLGTLRAHVARANPIAELLASGLPVVAVFTGPHAYVTPRWYGSPAANVPTWNYAAVHVHGLARAMPDRRDVRRLLADLSAKHEAGGGADGAWTVEGADPAYVEKLLGGIVAFSIAVERVEAKMKLSQNRTAEDRGGVTRGLRARGGPGDEALAEMMEADELRRRMA